MLLTREYLLQLIGLLLLIFALALVLVYALPRLSEKISSVATTPTVKRIKPSL